MEFFYIAVFKIIIFLLFTELLSSWESLLHWSENASVARKLQEEMLVLKSVLNKLGNRDGILDSESSIQMSIDELKVRMNDFTYTLFIYVIIVKSSFNVTNIKINYTRNCNHRNNTTTSIFAKLFQWANIIRCVHTASPPQNKTKQKTVSLNLYL